MKFTAIETDFALPKLILDTATSIRLEKKSPIFIMKNQPISIMMLTINSQQKSFLLKRKLLLMKMGNQ
jgi:hypothetical protein